MNRRIIGDAIRVFLQQTTEKKFGLARIPNETELPYAIFYPLQPGPPDYEDWENPEAIHWYPFQVTCVGMSHEQTAALSDAVYAALFDRDPARGNKYVHEIIIAGPPPIVISYRKEDTRGMISQPPGGPEQLFQCADQYRVLVQ